MTRILTVTLNPAVDKTYFAQSVMAGQVNRMRTMEKIAGGKGVNVTKILRQYGCEVVATGFLGGGSGSFIEEELLRRGAECRFVRTAEETRSNMNIIADDGYVTEILEPGPKVTAEEQALFMEQYEALLGECGLVILSGSVAGGLQTDIYALLIELAAEKGVPVYLDSSGESLRLGIRAKPELIKPNWKELEYIMGHSIRDREGIIRAAALLHREGISRVIVSMGSKGLVSVTDSGIYYARTEEIPAVNTVGCGDSVVASCAISAVLGETEEAAVVRACAIAAANATTKESANIPMETAEALWNKIIVEKIPG
ncbi:MAG: 1-phosphofructokinase family hexose kinase [Clostridiales bacterium]|nr:1-phosphofructokinase family hexose kinase [Clostridiales bacterium]